jgi:DNA-binding transcriptional LysR family regulator
MDQLKSMRTFVHIAEAGGVARAAAGLGVAPAAAAQALAELEAHLGTRLLKRPGRLALTPSGHAYLARSRAMLADLAAADSQTRAGGPQPEPSGRLRLQVSLAFAVHQLAKHLPDFHARFPRVTVELHAPGGDADADEDYDLAIHWRHLPQRHAARARRLARTDVILCAAPEYLDLHGRPDEPGALAGHRLLLPPRAGREHQGLVLMRGSQSGGAGRMPRAVVQGRAMAPVSTPHPELAYASALACLGICGLPSFVVEDAVLEGALERVLPAWHLDRGAIWASTPARRPEPSLSQAMLGFLLEVFGGQDTDPFTRRM